MRPMPWMVVAAAMSVGQAQAFDLMIVRLAADGRIWVGEQEVTLDTYGAALQHAMDGRSDERIMIRADTRVTYEQISAIMQATQDAGFFKVALVAEERAP